MPRRCRTVVALLLSILLVGMQAEAHRHALSHYATIDATQQPAWHAPSETPCAECALLAGCSAGLIDQAAEPRTPPITGPQPDAAFVSPAPACPSFYRSRAPPSRS